MAAAMGVAVAATSVLLLAPATAQAGEVVTGQADEAATAARLEVAGRMLAQLGAGADLAKAGEPFSNDWTSKFDNWDKSASNV